MGYLTTGTRSSTLGDWRYPLARAGVLSLSRMAHIDGFANMESDLREIIYLSLGSNLGDREANLESVIEEFPPAIEVIVRSSIYQTEPWGFEDQPDFLNMVAQGKTELAPRELLTYLKKIEKKIGRKPSFIYGPRLVDVDILFYGEKVVDEIQLTIPHDKIPERAFVLVPLMEIAPDLKYPDSDQTISDLANSIDTSGVSLYEGS